MEKQTRNRYAIHDINCVHCGGIFQATRYDAKFCGVACRKAHSRQESEIKERAKAIQVEIENFARKYSGKLSGLEAPAAAAENRANGARRVEMVAELIQIKALVDGLIDRYDY